MIQACLDFSLLSFLMWNNRHLAVKKQNYHLLRWCRPGNCERHQAMQDSSVSREAGCGRSARYVEGARGWLVPCGPVAPVTCSVSWARATFLLCPHLLLVARPCDVLMVPAPPPWQSCRQGRWSRRPVPDPREMESNGWHGSSFVARPISLYINLNFHINVGGCEWCLFNRELEQSVRSDAREE
jgi:hypothetical protein